MIVEILQASHQPVLQNANLQQVGIYAVIGAIYSIAGWLNSRAKRGASVESFSIRKAGQTVLIGAVAGGVVASQGQSLTAGNVEAASAVAIPIVNQVVNMSKYSSQSRDRATDDNR